MLLLILPEPDAGLRPQYLTCRKKTAALRLIARLQGSDQQPDLLKEAISLVELLRRQYFGERPASGLPVQC